MSPAEKAEALKTIGEYELLGEVGRGGMGSVYKARNKEGEIVAVKILSHALANNDVMLKRFYQEAGIAKRLEHPNIVRALDVGEDRGRHYFAMEFVDGVNVGELIKRNGKFPEKDALQIISQVARAIHKAHKEALIHRDIKPDNILVTRDGQVKLTDMGLSKELEADLNLTRTGRGLGTPHFMAPEQFKNAKNANALCDIYSLGATLYMMVTGELPFRGSSALDAFLKKSANDYTPAEELNPELSRTVARAIRRSMDADPNQRPQNVREFVEFLKGNITPPSVSYGAVGGDTDDQQWYVVFEDDRGVKQKLKGPLTPLIRQLQRSSALRNARGALAAKGPYRPLREIDEFSILFMDEPDTDVEANTPTSDETERTPAFTLPAQAPSRRPQQQSDRTRPRTQIPLEPEPVAPKIPIWMYAASGLVLLILIVIAVVLLR